MEDKIIDMVYDLLKDKNLYNYDNDKELENAEIEEYKNLLNENVIKIRTKHKEFIISCDLVYADNEAYNN